MGSASRLVPRRRYRGQGALELVLVLPVLLLLIFGGLDFARAVALHDALNSGTGIATRALSLDPSQWSWADGTVRAEVSNNVFGTAGIGPISYSITTSSGKPLANLSFGDTFCLTSSSSFTPAVPFIAGGPIPISSRHCGIVERMP
jgi:Flp pilus assembly protein TadG